MPLSSSHGPVVYTWPDDWSIVRILKQTELESCVAELLLDIHTFTGSLDPWTSLGPRTQWRWPGRTIKRTVLEMKFFDSFSLVRPSEMQPVYFALVSSQDRVLGLLQFGAYRNSAQEENGSIPRLRHVLTVDGSRAVHPDIQGRLFDFVFNFVYPHLFGRNQIWQFLKQRAEWGIGLPNYFEDKDFEKISSSDAKARFDEGIQAFLSGRRSPELLAMHEVQNLMELISGVLFTRRDWGLKFLGTGENDNDWRWGEVFQSPGQGLEPLYVMIGIDLSSTDWSWGLGWGQSRTDARIFVRGQDLVELLIQSGVAIPDKRYWQLIEDLSIPGESTFDPEVLESYELLEVLAPLYGSPKVFQEWWGAL